MKNKRRYIKSLDGLRSIAVIVVILYHLNATIFKGGFLGVPIFMVISGYLVTDHLIDEYELTGRIAYFTFLKKRIKRLYPTLLVMLLTTAAYIFLFARNLLFNLWQIVLTNLLYVYNWWQIAHKESYFQQFATNESPYTHLWTLSIEMQFYLVWPLLVMLILKLFGRKKYILYIAVLLIVISSLLMAIMYVPNTDPSRIYYGTDTRMFSILLGAVLAIVWPSGKLSKHVATKSMLILDSIGVAAFLGILLLLINVNGQSGFVYQGGMLLFSVITTIMIAVITQPVSGWNKILSNPLFAWIGSRSYAIYIYQFPVMIFFEARFQDIANHPVLYPTVEVIIILLISELSYRFLEDSASKIYYLNLIRYSNYIDINATVFKFTKHQKKFRKQNVAVLTIGFFTFLGVLGIINSAFIKSDAVNKTALAKKLVSNGELQKKEEEQQKKIARKAIADSSKTESEAKSNISAKSDIDTSFEAYNLTQTQLQKAQTLPLTAIGDSVMLASQPAMVKVFPKMYIDAAVSRQASAAVPLLEDLAKQHLLAPNVLIGLGTNGPIDQETFQAIMTTIGPKRNVYWINTHVPNRSWQNQVNAFLDNETKQYTNLKIIDWYAYSNNHNQWFYSDQTHPNNIGEMYYTAYIVKEIIG